MGNDLPDPATLIAAFASRYLDSTATRYRQNLRHAVRTLGHPFYWTHDACITFATNPTATGPAANNTVRGRYADMRSFLDWLATQNYRDTPTLPTLYSTGPLKSYKRTYGKVQGKRPARRLTRSQAFDQLVAACQDGTQTGLRDEVAFRLGLSGMRISEIVNLTVADCQTLPDLRWTGKGRSARRITAGAALCEAIRSLIRILPDQTPTARLILPGGTGTSTNLSRSRRTCSDQTIRKALLHRAATASLGHVAPHDLRRTAASILHNAKTPEGGHLFDLLDIQRVLGHADPATTMKCYIEQDCDATLNRAAGLLD